MSHEINVEGLKHMLYGAVKIIREKHVYLSEMDTAIGDGDHGVTMLRAMNGVQTTVNAFQGKDAKSLINAVGMSLLSVDGGATGPLLGSLFLGMADALEEQETIDSPTLSKVFEAGLAELLEQTKAKVGDKTMIDALVPAVEAIRKAAGEGCDPSEMFRQACEAAEKGALSTKDLRARFGRAKNQGDRTIGHQDPGATSVAFLFQGMRDGLIERKQA
jgi:phosphoenolpyruvate---glycerone phosphotransferase subunit DhaL